MSDHPMMKCGCAAQGVKSSSGALKFDPPIPACVIHDCIEVADAPPDLAGRMANCAYGDHAVKPSDPERLAFFEYRGPGSRWATEICKCGYAKVAHETGRVKCREFQPRGPHERDTHYCGCRGWD